FAYKMPPRAARRMNGIFQDPHDRVVLNRRRLLRPGRRGPYDDVVKTLETLRFDNTYARLPEVFGAKLAPTPFTKPPYLVSFNPDAALLLDLDPREAARPEFVEYFSGARRLPGSEPVAMRYAGHQFGHYVPQLGDGRAILLGEV